MKTVTCLDYAMKYIYRFPKSEKELVAQLLKKGYTEKDVDETIRFLKKKNFVNDKNFAESYIRGHAIRKGKPLFIVVGKLKGKGVDKEIIDEVVKEYEDRIEKGILKKIEREIEKMKDKGLSGFDIIQKLVGKGYNLDQIKKLL